MRGREGAHTALTFIYQQIPAKFRFQLANICILDPPPSFEIQYGIGINFVCACAFFSSSNYKIIIMCFFYCRRFVSNGMTAYTTANECHIVVLSEVRQSIAQHSEAYENVYDKQNKCIRIYLRIHICMKKKVQRHS